MEKEIIGKYVMYVCRLMAQKNASHLIGFQAREMSHSFPNKLALLDI